MTKPRSEMTVDELLLRKWQDHYRNADTRGLINNLSREQYMLMALAPCFYCGDQSTVNGVDRMDCAHGYITGNCVTACRSCNYAKGKMSSEEFIDMCIRVSQKWLSLVPATVLPKGPIQ